MPISSPNLLEDPSHSAVFRRVVPSVMLIRVDVEREPELRLEQLPVRVLRVRHPLQAHVRAQVLRPEVMIIGHRAHPADVLALLDLSYELGSAILQLSPLVAPDAVRGWVERMLPIVRERRGEVAAAAMTG